MTCMDNYISVSWNEKSNTNLHTKHGRKCKQTTNASRLYILVELKCLRDNIYHDNHYRILPAYTCKEIIDLKIYKRRRQGCRAGVNSRKQQNPRYADLSNLSNIKMSNKSDSNYSEVRIAMVTIQSVKNKDLGLHQHVCDTRTDLCVLTETWLSSKPDDKTWQICTPLNNSPFRISISNRTGKSGGCLKKIGLALVASNYCLLSNLPFFSKVLEICVVNQFTAHCNTNKLLPGYQLAYRRNYSCETALIKITNDCLGVMENQMVTVVVAINLSTTFDTVDHEILLEVLNKKSGLQETVLKWFNNYLRQRSCKVSVHGEYSKEHQLPFSVPQGSVAGLVLYNAYASMLQEVVQPLINLHGFADDHTITDSFRPDCNTEAEGNVIRSLEGCTTSIKWWMDENRLQMNNAKMDFILDGLRQQLMKCQSNNILGNGETIQWSSCIRYLGALADDRLSFTQHITNKCRTAVWNLQKLKVIRSVLTEYVCKTLAGALVMSHLDYANTILTDIP